jgi:transcriptional regulator with XRE-family HTH domain
MAHKIALTKAHLIAYKMGMPPPIIPLRFAKYLGIHEQTVSKFNTMTSRPGLKIACLLAKIARDLGQTEVTILDWRPDLLDKEIWPEIVRAVRSAKLYKGAK